MRRSLLVALLVSALIGTGFGLLGPVEPASAASTFTVTTTLDSARTVGSLRWALTQSELVPGPATIQLQFGQTYVLSRCAALSEDVGTTGDLDVVIDSTLSITGNAATIRQTCPGERVLQTTGGDLSVNNLRVTGGDAEPDANQADPHGGGILSGDLTLFNTTVEGNASTGSGGGVRADGLTMFRGILRANTSGGNGGGAAVLGTAAMNRSMVTGNTAAEGGGIVVGLGALNLDTSIAADNAETTPGVGTADGVELDVFSGTIGLVHSTVRGGAGDGPAIHGNTTLTASVVSQGQADAACDAGVHTSNGHNVDDDGSCDLDEGTDQPDVADVGLGPDLLPSATSVLRDHETTCAPGQDRRDVPRPQGPGCEIGAIELNHQPDAELRRNGTVSFVGNDVLNATGVDQTLVVNVGVNPAKVDLRVQNDGDVPDAVLVRGPASNARFTVRYLRGTNDVTAEVVAGTFSTAALAPGARSSVLTMVVGRRPTTPVGALRNLPVTFTSSLDADRLDVVLPKARRN